MNLDIQNESQAKTNIHQKQIGQWKSHMIKSKQNRGFAMKHLPNLISVVRIVGSFALLFVTPFSIPFFVLYGVCGISDMLDGMLARKLKCTSNLGAVLDGVGDLTLCIVLLIKLIPILRLPVETLLWIGLIAGIRILSFGIGYVKYKGFAALHTLANKATGFLLFAFPIFYVSIGLIPTTILLCCVATLSAFEELLITIGSKRLDRDVRSIFNQR